MRSMSHFRLVIVTGVVAVFPISGLGQGRAEVAGSPLTGPPVVGAPFSASAMTTITGVRADGTRFERSMPAVYYRDAAGRVRVELTIDGQGPRISVQPEPGQSMYWLDASKRSARRIPTEIEGWVVGGGKHFGVPVAVNKFLHVARFRGIEDLLSDATEESLGSRQIAGIETIGRRIVLAVPVGYLGNGRPLDIVDERWESTELHLVIESRYSDPRFGLVEYGLTHIRRGEPPSDLFVVPDDYNNNAPADEPWLDFIPFDGFLSGRAVIPPSTKPSHK
jgi:hypothetical protein